MISTEKSGEASEIPQEFPVVVLASGMLADEGLHRFGGKKALGPDSVEVQLFFEPALQWAAQPLGEGNSKALFGTSDNVCW
jgi:hypothetical protein